MANAPQEPPRTYVPLGGPPEGQVDLWPKDAMPGNYYGLTKLPPAEQFLRTNETPPANQELRFRCSPRHVGTHGHFVMHVSNPTIAPFLVEGSDTAVVIAPSGGGMHLNWDVESVSPAKMYNSWGISAFIVKFRVPSEHWNPGAVLQDTQRAISLVRAKYKMRRVGIHGACFGGKTAVEVASQTRRLYLPIDEVDDSSAVPDFTVLLYPQMYRVLMFPPVLPPVFAAVSRDDNCVGTTPATYFAAAVRSRRAPSELHLYPKGMHGWGTCEYYPFLQGELECNWPTQLAAFLPRINVTVRGSG